MKKLLIIRIILKRELEIQQKIQNLWDQYQLDFSDFIPNYDNEQGLIELCAGIIDLNHKQFEYISDDLYNLFLNIKTDSQLDAFVSLLLELKNIHLNDDDLLEYVRGISLN